MVEIIPRPVEKTPMWHNLLLFLSVVILIITIGIYFFLSRSQTKAKQDLDGLNKNIAELETSERKNLENETLQYKKKIEDFNLVFANHRASSKLFEFLEDLIHPKVQLSRFELNTDQATVKFDGKTDSFVTLGQQLIIFRQNENITQTNLPEISISEKELGINFTFDLVVQPDFLRF